MEQHAPLVAEHSAIYLTASECDALWELALSAGHKHPQATAMLMAELDRAELCDLGDLPAQTVVMNSQIEFVDETSGVLRTVQLVYPGDADIAEGRISILTPIGAGLIGMRAGYSIRWPDRDGREKLLRIVSVTRLQKTEPTIDELSALSKLHV